MSRPPQWFNRGYCTIDGRHHGMLLVSSLELRQTLKIPQECIHPASEIVLPGDQGDLTVYRWYAEEEGWCDESD